MKGGEEEMQSYAEYRLRAVSEQRQREFRQVQADRQARRRRSGSSYSVRRAVGRSVVRLGERLAGESSPELVRSR